MEDPDSGDRGPEGERSGSFRPHPPAPSHRYNAPPRIRTTGEVPAVTGEVPAEARPQPRPPVPPPDRDAWSAAGSVVDRPAPTPPDWMSGVQVPELLVTRDIDRSELAEPVEAPTLAQTIQRVVGLVLVAILVAVVVLVVVGSVNGWGSGL